MTRDGDGQTMVTSRQTERSRQTDQKVAASTANAVRRDGVDQLALTRVASDAGYSSGVIYARCDDRSELMVLAWQRSFWPAVSGVLEAALHAAGNHDETAMDRAVSAWVRSTACMRTRNHWCLTVWNFSTCPRQNVTLPRSHR
ncbi:MAG: hypothetical protein ACKOBO_06015 [Acidimicrobiales bacterium]